MRIAFHAPMKAPDHPVPSGDRTMARGLLKALRLAGHAVTQPSSLRSFLATPDEAGQRDLVAEAERNIGRIAALWDATRPPELWFTYHNHYKAPDLIGPELTRRFALPYVIAEASHAPKRAITWPTWHAAAEVASRAASLHVCFTTRDRAGLMPILASRAKVLDLPPFLDMPHGEPRSARRGASTLRFVTVAMMRHGDKLASYRLLAEALSEVVDLPWHLDIIGDGPARAEVDACLATLPPGRVTLHGMMDRAEAWRTVAESDLFLWPGFGEAYGLAYLEAQALGIPVLALGVSGVAAVVRHGETGLLVAEPSRSAYAGALRGLMSDRDALARMGAAGRRFVRDERSLEAAAVQLDTALRDCLERKIANHG